MMNRLCAALETVALLAGLLALAIPMSLACCAGAVAPHGPDCCEAAVRNAAARSCCAGDGEERTLGSKRQPVAQPLVATVLPPVAAPAAAEAPHLDGAALPPLGDLFTLHSALLL